MLCCYLFELLVEVLHEFVISFKDVTRKWPMMLSILMDASNEGNCFSLGVVESHCRHISHEREKRCIFLQKKSWKICFAQEGDFFLTWWLTDGSGSGDSDDRRRTTASTRTTTPTANEIPTTNAIPHFFDYIGIVNSDIGSVSQTRRFCPESILVYSTSRSLCILQSVLVATRSCFGGFCYTRGLGANEQFGFRCSAKWRGSGWKVLLNVSHEK